MADTTHYDVLGTSRDVSDEELRRAYRRLMRVHHPDIAGPAGVVMSARMNEAFEVLSDPVKRRNYDRELDTAADTTTADAGESWPEDVPGWAPEAGPHNYSFTPEDLGEDEGPSGRVIYRTWSSRTVKLLLSVAAVLFIIMGAAVWFLHWNAFEKWPPGPPVRLLPAFTIAAAAVMALWPRPAPRWTWVVLAVSCLVWPVSTFPDSWFAWAADEVDQWVFAAGTALSVSAVGFRIVVRELWYRWQIRPSRTRQQ